MKRIIWLLTGITSLMWLLTACHQGPTYQPRDDTYNTRRPPLERGYGTPGNMMDEQKEGFKPLTGPEVKVGLLVPLSGDAADLGQALLDAGMLALFDKYATMEGHVTQVVLVPKDTEGTPQGATKAAKEALDEGAQLIIGPLFGESVKAVAPIAKARNVQVITFSNNKEVAARGTYISGFMPDQQVQRVVGEAFQHQKNRIAALLPSNAYGNIVADALRKMMILHNKPLVGIEFYPPGATDVDIEIQRLFGGRQYDKPEVDAVLLAEGGERLKMILARLKSYGVTNDAVQFLGTGLWDDDALLGMSDVYGGWFASSPLRSYRGFEQRFTNNYGYQPQRLASLAYDSVALAATLAQQPGQFSASALTDPSGYSGPANGIFRLRVDGISERGLAVLQVDKNGFKQISAAPRTFLQVNY